MNRFSIIGAAHLDALVEGVEAGQLRQGSTPAERIRLGFGGDALNEAGTLARQAGVVWFALDGRLADGRRAHLVISPDGRSLSLTVADARSGMPPGAGTHALSG